MAKKQAAQAQVGTLVITQRNVPVEYAGQLVSAENGVIVLDVKRPRTSKVDRHVFPLAGLLEAHLSEEGTSYLYVRGEQTVEHAEVTLVEISENGAFSGTYEGKDGTYAIYAPAGSYVFLADGDAEEEAKPAAKKPAGKPAAPAKGKGKAEPEEEEEEEAEEEEEEAEEEEEEAYEPEVGSYVTVTDEEGEEVTGEVTALNTKQITLTVDEEDVVFKLAKVTIAEAKKPAAKKGAGKGKADAKKGAGKGKADAKPAAAKKGAAKGGDEDWD